MKNVLLALFILLACYHIGAINVVHLPPANFVLGAQTELRLEVIQGWDDLTEAKVMYKAIGETRWQGEIIQPETPDGPWLIATIPALQDATQGLEYYFEFYLSSGVIETLPIVDPSSKAYNLQLFTRQGDFSASFILLSDESTFSEDDGFILAVSFFDIAEEVDPASISVFVNGEDVTSNSVIGETTILYREDNPKIGIKSSVISAKLKNGEPIYSDTWLTDITPGSARTRFPIAYRGSANFTSNMYSYSADENALVNGKSRDDASSSLDLYGKWKLLDFQTNLYISSREKSNQQPVNKYTFGFQLPHWENYFGDYMPHISPLTMSGRNIRGLYSRFYTPVISLSWAHGEMVRKTTSSFVQDSLVTINSGTFKQEALAGKVQMGSDNGFNVSLNFARNRDIVSSLDPSQFTSYTTDANDVVTDTLYTVLPTDNLVISVEPKLTIPIQNVVLGAEFAWSWFNRNTLEGSMTTEEIEEYVGENIPVNIDDFSGIFTFNKSVEPFMPGKTNLAWNTYFRTYFKFFWDNLFNISYSEVGSAFKATSTSGIQTDAKTISVTHQMNYLQYFYLNGGYNRTQDNLMGHKTDTNVYDSYYAQSIIRLPKVPYLKASYFVNAGDNKINTAINDSTAFIPYERNSKTLSLGLGYNFVQIPYVPTQLDVTWRNGSDDYVTNQVLATDNVSSSINVSITNNYTMAPLRTQVAFATTNQDMKINDTKNKNFNILLQADYALLENKIKPFFQYRNVSLGGDQDNQNYGFYTLGFNAYPIKDLTVSSSLGVKSFSNDSSPDKDYSATTWRLSLTQKF